MRHASLLCMMLAALTMLAGVQSSAADSQRANPTATFPMYVNQYGAGGYERPAVCGTLDAFREGRVPLPLEWDKPVNPVTKIARVGQVGNREIYEVSYLTKLKSNEKDPQYDSYTLVHGTLIRWGADGEYCAFRLISVPKYRGEEDKDRLPLGEIVQLDEPVYIVLIRTPGTGYFWDESYYGFNRGVPVSLKLDQQAAALVGQYFPAGCEQRKGGNFCYQHMEWRSGLWRVEDPECCGSCGAISVRFRYAKRTLTVVDHTVYLDPDAMREIRPSPGCRW